MKNKLSILSIGLAIVFSSGCATSGNKLDPSKVSQIKKGVTTRAEVEALLGSPSHVGMGGEGRRVLMYNFSEAQTTGRTYAGMGARMIGSALPFGGGVGAIAAGGAVGAAGATQHGTKVRQQMLQIIVGKDNVVEDFEFSDNTTNTDSGFGVTTIKTEKTAPEGKK